MKYTMEILDTALDNLQSKDIKERKKAATFFMRAACAELGTKNTKPVKEWFIVNTKNYLSAIKEETNPEMIWIYLYTLQNFCARYLHLNHLYIIDSDIMAEDTIQNFEERSQEYAYDLLKKQTHPKVLQGIASFFWIYRQAFVWDLFIEVLKQKKDKLTLSHIGIAIRQCYDLSQENNRSIYISDIQLKELLKVLETKKILQKEMKLLENLYDCS
ncbi:hypothetical protein [Bulleidia extructa]|uniref:hypothetical protein n=1 Tax=Bulleidia extructa TaxID=118748 RepID=UPI003BEFCD59